MKYPIVIHKDKDSDFGASVPDLPGCFSAGESFEEALLNVMEAIETHLEGIIIDKEPVPPPSSINEHQKNPYYSDGVWALVDIDLSKLMVKTKRINITMPENVIYSTDDYARKHNLSRSSLLTQAVTEYMANN